MIQGLLSLPFYRWKNWDTKEFSSWSETDPTPCPPGLLSLPGPQALATGLCFRKWIPWFPWSWSPRHTPSSATAARVPGTPNPGTNLHQDAFLRVSAEGLDDTSLECWGKWPSGEDWATMFPVASLEKSRMHSNQPLVAKLRQRENIFRFAPLASPSHFLSPSPLFSWSCTSQS